MASYRQPHQSLLHAAWNHARNRALTHQSDAGLLPLTQSPKAYPASPLFIARFSCPFGASLGARNDKKERVAVSVGPLPRDIAVVGADAFLRQGPLLRHHPSLWRKKATGSQDDDFA